jgi:superfamily II DNA helicase RecQ
MYPRVVTLRYDDNLAGFPEKPLQAAIAGREVLAMREHFFIHAGVPHLTLMLELGGGAAVGFKSGNAKLPEGMPDVMATVPSARRKLYLDLKRWRNERAKIDGVPPFVVMRNDMLAEVCCRAPHSLAALKEIPGVGEKTVEKYGSDLLALIPEGLNEEPREIVGTDSVARKSGGGNDESIGREEAAVPCVPIS